MKTNKNRYFSDMDGVLAVYPDKNEAWWEFPKIFRYMAQQEKVVKALKKMIANGEEVFIISAYNADFPDAVEGKNYWLDKYLPEIDKEHRIFTVVGKKKTDYVPGGVQPTDVLLDDYNGNLEAWVEAGGIGIKLLNGLNNKKTWEGACVRANGTIKEIVETLTNTAKYFEETEKEETTTDNKGENVA